MDENLWKDIPIKDLNNYEAHPSGFVRNKLAIKIILAPQPDNLFAITSPIPLDAPVTMATLSVKLQHFTGIQMLQFITGNSG